MAESKVPSVGVIIPCFNQKDFLAGAIESAMEQRPRPWEIIVVDDGSSDDLRQVVSNYPQIHFIQQDNRGLAGARNSGLKAASSDKLIFLDSDDRLLPGAIESGLACFRHAPDAGFVYGAHRIVRGSEYIRTYFPVSTYRDLLQCNWVGMIATAMFDRAKLLEIGGFDESLAMCEDWDAFLRLSQRFHFASHDHGVADYVKHDNNASNDLRRLWTWIEVVRAKAWDRGLEADDEAAWRKGEAVWQGMLGPDPARTGWIRRAARKLVGLLRNSFRS
jgi:glycosyltransferase involved in cell wall biosynthesis